MNTVLEHSQLKPFDASGLISRQQSPVANARSLAARLSGEPVMALSVAEEAISVNELVSTANELPPGATLHVFMRVYVDPKAPNIIARFVPADRHDHSLLRSLATYIGS